MTRLEKHIAADIRHFLELQGYRAVRCVAGPTRGRAGQQKPEAGNPPGFPDWVFVGGLNLVPYKRRRFERTPRRFYLCSFVRAPEIIFIETKRPGRRPTKIQQAWLEVLRKDGFVAEWFDGFQVDEGSQPFLPWWEGKS